MVEAKKPRAKRPTKAASLELKADLIELAAIPAVTALETVKATKPATQPKVPEVLPVAAEAVFSSAKKQGDAFRQAVSEAVTASAEGALEVNGKIIDALTIQSSTALDLWRSAISSAPLPEALKAQSQATRQAYESASAQWKAIAESTALWFTKSLEPLHSAFQRSAR
ncbi:phasin family protein [Microvirga terrestris]|uniref:Phasin family protein n=1 Tax=Microvirga terrestris TaxID=2791024 RepID=A0ABS0HQC9_9HYPH|nr:phasin family protein [Microvirga terrestris]MBF9195685.1 phasin family protein [Microvirga terrestris]